VVIVVIVVVTLVAIIGAYVAIHPDIPGLLWPAAPPDAVPKGGDKP
jgi:hypothetical protein